MRISSCDVYIAHSAERKCLRSIGGMSDCEVLILNTLVDSKYCCSLIKDVVLANSGWMCRRALIASMLFLLVVITKREPYSFCGVGYREFEKGDI